MRHIILSLATEGGPYLRQLERLGHSVAATRFDGEVKFWTDGVLPPGCPPHLESPFAFKPFAFAEIQRRGGDAALWLDAACLAVRPLGGLFAQIERDGYLLFANGSRRVGEWASDEAIARFDVSRDAALTMPEVNAAVIGLALQHPVGMAFLTEWLTAAREGVAFRGVRARYRGKRDYLDVKWNHRGRASSDPRVLGHRHDQTIAGLLAHRLGMTLATHGLESSSAGRTIRSDTVIVIDRDGGRPAALRATRGFVRRHPAIATFVRRTRRAWLALRGA